MKVLEVEKLTKDYGGNRGIFGVSFSVTDGQIVGLLGANGSGKSTLIDILIGLVRPDFGQAYIFEKSILLDRKKLHGRVGFLSSSMSFDDELTGWEQLTYFGNLHGGVNEPNIKMFADLFSIDLSYEIKDMSRGDRQKIGLIAALMNNPRLLILDEPMAELDQATRKEFIKLLCIFKNNGGTVLISVRELTEAVKFCNHLIILKSGQIAANAPIAQFLPKSKPTPVSAPALKPESKSMASVDLAAPTYNTNARRRSKRRRRA
jgi:ABC-2 type transport system ATP-binding protein